jgi:hypothetical protein
MFGKKFEQTNEGEGDDEMFSGKCMIACFQRSGEPWVMRSWRRRKKFPQRRHRKCRKKVSRFEVSGFGDAGLWRRL